MVPNNHSESEHDGLLMLLKIFVSAVWILCICLALVIENLRRELHELQKRVTTLEHRASGVEVELPSPKRR